MSEAEPVVYLSSEGPTLSALRGLTCRARGSNTLVHGFLGIPYARPPTGSRRFRAPEPTGLWQGVRQATQYGPICPQDTTKPRKWQFCRNLTDYDEDCLYLNVWTPRIQDGARLPVLVWIHGGAFVQGASNMFDGTPLCAYENVVFVSINYRMGVFGFLRTGDDPGHFHGNQAYRDQIEALRWIQKYIVKFGGDPENVTVFGESAGGISISFLQTVPEARGLFRRSICQSGSAVHGNALWSTESAEKYYMKRLKAMGYAGSSPRDLVSFINTKSTDDLLRSFNDWFVPSTLDGEFFRRDPYLSYKHGLANQVDTIIGFNSTESLRYTPPGLETRQQAAEATDKIVRTNFYRGRPAAVADRVSQLMVAQYVEGHAGDNMTEAVCNFHSDTNFVGASLLQAKLFSRQTRTYVYHFDHRPSFSAHPAWVRADHTEEIPFALGFPFCSDISYAWTQQEEALSRQMMRYWANFARTGNPNDAEGPVWSQFDADKPLAFSLPQYDVINMATDPVFCDRYRLWTETMPSVLEGSAKSKY